MQIRQIQVAHDRVEDRLTLRIATQADEEYRIFITRRLLRDLWPHLAGLVTRPQTAADAVAPSDAPKPAASNPSFDQPFKEDKSTYPLGMRPLLASEVSVTVQQDSSFLLVFKEGKERVFRVVLPMELMQAVCAMLRASCEVAKWDLALDYSTAIPELPKLAQDDPDTLPLVAPTKRSLLH